MLDANDFSNFRRVLNLYFILVEQRLTLLKEREAPRQNFFTCKYQANCSNLASDGRGRIYRLQHRLQKTRIIEK